jgi:hypothetical protein
LPYVKPCVGSPTNRGDGVAAEYITVECALDPPRDAIDRLGKPRHGADRVIAPQSGT